MSRARWFAAVLLLSLSVRPAAAQVKLGWRWQEKEQFYVEWNAAIQTQNKLREDKDWARPVVEKTHVVYRVTVLKRYYDGSVELELVLEGSEVDLMQGRLDPKIMEGLPVRATLDAGMNVTRIDGLEGVLQKRYGTGPRPPHAAMFQALVEDAWREWLQSTFIPLSGMPVGSDAKWEQRTEKALPPMGRHVYRKTFVEGDKLANAGRELRQITVTAASALVPYRAEEVQGVHKVKQAQFLGSLYAGTYLFDPSAGRIVQAEVRQKTHLSATIEESGWLKVREALQEQAIVIRLMNQKPTLPGAASATTARVDLPCRHLLTGDDARRVLDMEKRVAKMTEAGLWGEALNLAHQVAQQRTRLQGAGHWQTVDAVWNVRTLEKLGTLSDRERLEFVAAGKLSPQIQQLLEGGKYADAAALMEKMWGVRLRVFKNGYPTCLLYYSDRAAVAEALGDPQQARQLYESALQLAERLLGAEHPTTAFARTNLADSLAAEHKIANAEPLYRQALMVYSATIGEENATTARAYENLAVALQTLGKAAEAQPYFDRALAISRRVFGEEKPETMKILSELAANLLALNRPTDAEPLLRRTLQFRLYKQGENHMGTALDYNNLAASLLRQNRSREAEPLLRKSLDIHRRVLGESHLETIRAYSQLGNLLRGLGKEREGQSLLRHAEELHRNTRGGS